MLLHQHVSFIILLKTVHVVFEVDEVAQGPLLFTVLQIFLDNRWNRSKPEISHLMAGISADPESC
jgi:hypothetical protein